MTPLRRVLIANRGEIAVRIARACREAGIQSVAVYSDADVDSPHVLAADRAVRIGPAAPSESYLSIPALLAAARAAGADAVHPGYGFLSERAAFARACEEAGLIFIGPPADAIERMGSKVEARELMAKAGVPVVPGQTPADQSDEGLLAAVRDVGLPALVKASAGGGGKGMRRLRASGASASQGRTDAAGASASQGRTDAAGASASQGRTDAAGASASQGRAGAAGASASQGRAGAAGASASQGRAGAAGASASQGRAGAAGASASQGQSRSEAEAVEMIAAARREALAAFGDGTLYVERLIERPRHVEIQVFGDAHGNVVHLFERECSVQRRHQKIVEESPCPALTPALRAAMGEAAVAAARAVGYRNAGTVEFLLEGDGDAARFYFLEMNTRLQVEHPVTELVTGVDLVRAQLQVAAGERLPWTQEDLSQRGHAIECRVYAEDPAGGFLPQAGPLLLYREPQGPGIRVDAGVVEGGVVAVNYDPLLAKLIVHAETRDGAIARAVSALRRYPVLGIRTNVPFLIRILESEAFQESRMHTTFVDDHLAALLPPGDVPLEAAIAAARAEAAALSPSSTAAAAIPDPWATLAGWGR
jgi:acetyl/propionyl-CoA carboxylase alpha subunit